MPLRPRTVKRLSLLLVALLIMGALTWLWREHRLAEEAKLLRAARQEGMQAWNSGDYVKALRQLGRYVAEANPQQVRDDFPARLTHARARARVGAPGDRHLDQAARLLSGLLADEPDHPQALEARHALMYVLVSGSRWGELRRLADGTLELYPDDRQSLRMRRLALEQRGEPRLALAAAQRLNELDPHHLDDQIQTLRLLAATGVAAPLLVERAVQLTQSHPDDPRFLLLLAVAYSNAGQQAQAAACLEQAASAPAPGDQRAQFVATLVGLFDAFGQFDRPIELYRKALQQVPDPRLRQRLALRHWQADQSGAAMALLAEVPIDDPSTDPRLVATKALLLFETGQPEQVRQAEQAVRTLVRCATLPDTTPEQQRLALGWSEALSAIYLEDDQPVEPRLRQLHRAAQRLQHGVEQMPVFGGDQPAGLLAKWLGDLQAQLGEAALAVRDWKRAAAELPGWSEPWRLIAETQLAADQLGEAEAAAKAAELRADGPAHAQARALLTQIAYRRWQTAPSTAGADTTSFLAAEHQRTHPLDPRTLPIHVHMTALADPEEARAIIDRALKEHPEDAALRVALAEVSLAANLQREDALLAELDTPEALALRAELLHKGGREEQAAELLRRGIASADAPSQRKAMELALARFFETADPDAAQALWADLGRRYAGDLDVQLAILEEAQSVQADQSLQEQTIARLRQLTGEGGRRWRREMARLLLSRGDRDSALEAVDLLRELIRAGEGTDTIDARVLLAEGLLIGGNSEAALEHLRAAHELDLTRGDVGLRLIALLEEQGQQEAARRVLGRLAAEGVRGDRERLEVADRLAEDGEPESAINLLRQAEAAGDLEPAGRVVLAEMLARRGNELEAESVYESVLALPSPPPSALLSAAVFYGRQGETERAEAILARTEVNSLSLPDRQVIRAVYAAQLGDFETARGHFEQAIAADPPYVSPWREAAAFELSRGAPQNALALMEQAAGRAGEDERARALRLQAAAAASVSVDDNSIAKLQALMRALRQASPEHRWDAAASEVQRAVALLEGTGRLPASQLVQLEQLGRTLSLYVPLHAVVVEGYLQMDRQEDAFRVARRLAEAAPFNPEAQRLAYATAREARRYAEAERFAEQWRRTYGGDPIYPDTAVADVRMLRGDFTGAVSVINAHLERARRDSENFYHLLGLAAEAYAAAGNHQAAFDIVAPYLASSAAWRATAIRLAADHIHDAEEATRWLRTIEEVARSAPSISEPSSGGEEAADPAAVTPKERLERAIAWCKIGTRFDDPKALLRGRSRIEALTSDELRNDPAAWDALARASIVEENFANAEAAFRRVLALNPRAASSANELAFLLLRRQNAEANAEALSWARVATDEAPGEPAHQDTLARAHLAAGNIVAARAAFERALRLDESYLDAMLGLATVMYEEGETERAERLFARLEPIYRLTSEPHAHLQREFERLADAFGTTLP